MNNILESMKITREYCSLFKRLRSENNIPLRTPLLDFAMGSKKCIYLEKEYIRLIAEDINIYNQGYDFANRNFYYGYDVVKPIENEWKILEYNNYWVALNINIPNWLQKISEQRKKDRKDAMRRKKLGLPYLK